MNLSIGRVVVESCIRFSFGFVSVRRAHIYVTLDLLYIELSLKQARRKVGVWRSKMDGLDALFSQSAGRQQQSRWGFKFAVKCKICLKLTVTLGPRD